MPPHKVDRPVSEPRHRLAMVELAIADNPAFEASRLELDRTGPSYTADTLSALLAGDQTRQLYVILGSDAAVGLPGWERADEVRGLSTIVVVERPGSAEGLPQPGWSWVRVEVPRLEVSSTDLRARVVDGRPLDYLLTPAVIDTIQRRGLYRESVAR